MANELKINLIVNDDGTATIKSFSDNASANLRKVTDAGSNMKTGFAQTWQGMATGINQASQLIQQLVGVVQPMIQAFMASEQATQKLGIALLNQGEYSREALGDMEEFAEQMQKTTTVEDDLAKSVMAGLKSFGMTTEEVKRSTRAAADMAAFTGKSIETVADLLGKAYAGNTAALGRYGIVVDDSVPKAQKFEAVLGQLEQRFGGAAQAELDTYSGQWKQIQNQWSDIQEVLGLGVLKSIQALEVGVGLLGVVFLSVGSKMLQVLDFLMTPVNGLLMTIGLIADAVGADGLSAAMDLATKSISEARSNILASKDAVMEWTSKQYDNMVATDNVTKSLDKMGNKTRENISIDEEAAKAAKKLAEEREKTIKKITDDLTKFAEDHDNINKSQYEKDIEWLNKQVAEYEKAGGDKKNIAQLIADAMVKIDAKAYEEMAKNARKSSEEAIKSWEDEIAAGVKAGEESLKRIKDRGEAERKIYEDVRGYETQAYDASIKLIADQAENYKQLGVDEVAIAAWVAEETRKAELKKAEYSDSFFAGVKAGLDDIAAKQKSWGNIGIETVKSFSSSASSTMGSVFFDAYKGQLKTSQEYFTAFTDAIMKTFTDALAKMIVEAALSKITMSFNATWTEGAGAVLGAVGKVLGYAADWFFSDAAAADWIPGQFAKGGLINGMNPGADSYAYDTIPAMLSPGEYVMPRSAVNPETVGALEYMRQTGQKPRGFADGGLVDFWRTEPNWKDLFKAQQGTGVFQGSSGAGGGSQNSKLSPYSDEQMRQMAIQALHNANPDLWEMLEGSWKCYKNFGVDPAVGVAGYVINAAPERMLQDPTAFGLMPASENWLYGKRINGAQAVFEYLLDHGTLTQLQKYWSSAYAPDNKGWTYTTFLLNRLNNKIGYGHDYGYSLKGNEARNDWFPWVHGGLMAASAAVSTYGAGLMGAALGAELLGAGAVVGGITGAQIGGAVGGAIGAGSFNAGQQIGSDSQFNWASMALSAASGAFSGALIGSSDLFTAGGQAARELSANTVGNAAYHQALSEGMSQAAAEVAYINAYNTAMSEASLEIVKDMGISALTGVGKKFAMNALLGMILDKPESGTLGISFNGISGGEGLAASIKNFPGSVGGSFGFPAKNGIDYIPWDNFPVRAHEGEGVLTKEENQRRRSGTTINYTFNLYATVADRAAINEFAEQIYPRLEKLRAWGH